MKDFRAKAYHRVYKKLFDVVGITGLNSGDPRIQSQDTTMFLKDVDLLLHIGASDAKNNKLFAGDMVEISVMENKTKVLRQGKIVFENAQHIIRYEKPTGINKFQQVDIINPDWESCNKIGSMYDPKKEI